MINHNEIGNDYEKLIKLMRHKTMRHGTRHILNIKNVEVRFLFLVSNT